MRQTWRWFGPHDVASVDDMRQAGVEGVVSALHHLAPGVVWPVEEIRKRQAELAVMRDGSPSGLKWEVVESLPISENIKRQTGDFRADIAAWKASLHNLAQCGIEILCYNFMPVLDWTRTDLAWRLPNGGTCMRFDIHDFAAFDIHILGRAGAADDFAPEVVEIAAERFAAMDDARKKALQSNIIAGLPGGAAGLSLDELRAHLAAYDGIDAAKARSHLVDFLSEVAPVAEQLGIRLCCHPDDPPMPLLGLPRVMSTHADYRAVLNAVDLQASGMTLCTGSLGARRDNDPVAIMRDLGARVHFLHLRNVKNESPANFGSFHEAAHLEGDTDMVAMIAAILAEENRRKAEGRADWQIPMRPDHGQDILDDLKRQTQPGYPSIGRLKGLAELRGIQTALSHPSLS